MKFCDIINNLQADVVSINKHQINFTHKTVINGPRQMFSWEAALSILEGHSVHRNVGWTQEGRTMMLAINELNQYILQQTWIRTQQD